MTAFAERVEAPFLELDDETWERCLDANLTAPFLVAREAARAMLADRGSGVVVHVGSDLGARPGPGSAAYAAAKAGVHLMAAGTALDLIPYGVRVCCVAAAEGAPTVPGSAPGPAELAAAVAFCASDAASYVVGSTYFLDGPVPIRG